MFVDESYYTLPLISLLRNLLNRNSSEPQSSFDLKGCLTVKSMTTGKEQTASSLFFSPKTEWNKQEVSKQQSCELSVLLDFLLQAGFH